jgi:hypothetical protein
LNGRLGLVDHLVSAIAIGNYSLWSRRGWPKSIQE